MRNCFQQAISIPVRSSETPLQLSGRHQHDLRQESPRYGAKSTTPKLELPKIFRKNWLQSQVISPLPTPRYPVLFQSWTHEYSPIPYVSGIYYVHMPKIVSQSRQSNDYLPRSIYGKHIIARGRIESGQVVGHTLSQKEVGSVAKSSSVADGRSLNLGCPREGCDVAYSAVGGGFGLKREREGECFPLTARGRTSVQNCYGMNYDRVKRCPMGRQTSVSSRWMNGWIDKERIKARGK